MTILRTIKCDVCGDSSTEGEEGKGWPHWGQVNGFALDKTMNPTLCRDCLVAVANFVNGLKHHRSVVDPMLPVLAKLNEET